MNLKVINLTSHKRMDYLYGLLLLTRSIAVESIFEYSIFFKQTSKRYLNILILKIDKVNLAFRLI